ncbi:MAG: hypothetical protein IKA07_02450 [Alistipes sp.]|nr:hypothetical protein [Alistipes sp.]
MDAQKQKRLIHKSIYYLITLIALGVSAWALYDAYVYMSISRSVWIFLCTLLSIYVVAILVVSTKLWGWRRFLLHTTMLQLLPICASIVTLRALDRGDTYVAPTGRPNQYERSFNDLQDKQKAAALENGVAPIESRAEIENNFKQYRRKLTHIETNDRYIVRDLTYSAPYVVPKVAELLDDLADKFQARTQSRTRFVVTSVLRTEEDVKKLRRVNINASTNSCHCNATTIDISYARFGADKVRPRDPYELRLALAEVLHELRKEGRCYVKIERKQYCYHITVR